MNVEIIAARCARALVAAISISIAFVITTVREVEVNAATSCSMLKSLALPNTSITSAEEVPAGTFMPPGAAPNAQPNPALIGLPSFCRITATLTPSSDSEIKTEVWLPVADWNRKLQAVGNGGLAGAINYGALGLALKNAYATTSTDTGHTGNTAGAMLAHPDKLVDFAYRSVHEMTVSAKLIVDAFYGTGPRLSYWNSCSTGGRQGLKEGQQFPNDFDGIIAGAPAIRSLAASVMWVANATLSNPASYIPPSKYPAIHRAALDACDAIDGLKDRLIDDPTHCRFDPAVLACQGEDGPQCLTAPQLEAARKILAPVRNSRTGQEVAAGLEPGAELGWGAKAAGPQPYAPTIERLKYLLFKDPNWNWRTFDFDRDLNLLEGLAATDPIDAVDPDLKAFASHGGKLLLYHGWSDALISPRGTIAYYNSVLDAMAGTRETTNWLRLFMVPGMGHCGGGDGPNTFDTVTALDQWVDKGQPPDQILATHRTNAIVDRTRPLCPYPQVARYNGTGSIDDAANFACRLP
jgi:feruloyl esterase